jgi:thioredoxin-like negative regulator of GroEL
VGDNFKSEVIDVEMPVVVYIHAEWCNHCSEFRPIYKYLANKYRDANIRFAEMDGEKNEYTSLEIERFPHIILYAKKATDSDQVAAPAEFSSQPNLPLLVSWINQHLPELEMTVSKEDMLVEAMLRMDEIEDSAIQSAKEKAQ